MSTMDRAEIFDALRQLLTEALSISAAEVRPEARLIEDLGAESIDLLDIRFRVEKAFDIKITTQDLAVAFGERITPEEFRRRFTVGALHDYVRARLEQAGG